MKTAIIISGIISLAIGTFSCNDLSLNFVKQEGTSEWVFSGKQGKLVYKLTPTGDRIMDFSHAGYMGGGVALPAVPVRRIVEPSGTLDDTGAIQQAIDEIASMPLNNGFRGAVLLSAGTFICSSPINISASGIVLRGTGSGEGGTTIVMAGDRHAAIVIGGRINYSEPNVLNGDVSASETLIADEYVPSGSLSFHVLEASHFQVGDMITIRRPLTNAWVRFMEMDNLVRDGHPQTWIRSGHSGTTTRQIAAIENNLLTIDRPLSDSYDAEHLNPPGTKISKFKPPVRTTQVGVEHLHVKCPPLEIAYGRAPYSGIRISGDDCWVKDVFFEETMNTITLAGNRITIQEVEIHHTFPNLGASKPTDFSIEGSQNLIDRCHVTGGNTYFVWTGSLVSGPNVVLNSTFSGHGSRIQPHMRWATGMLIDNCVIPDGGIDFPNRGVAGSGHGWTMGWGVIWNSVAKIYVVQNPPGAINWAIGCIGTREQTPRLFDSSPILPEGIFDSHGKPVSPQSLYLAQLEERLGRQALLNIGYASNNKDMFRTVEPLPDLLTEIDREMGKNLALHRPVNTSEVRERTRQFGGERALDGNENTYWATNDGTTSASFEVDTEGPLMINAVEIREAASLRPRVLSYKIEGQVDSDWVLLSEGTTIGERKIDKFPPILVWKVRLTILNARDFPAIGKFGMYLSQEVAL
jgi:hypothetical protein